VIEVKKDRIWQEFQLHIRRDKKKYKSTQLGRKFSRRADLFLKSSDFNEKTLQKIGNGNFGIVFKVELRSIESMPKIVAVKKTTHAWNAKVDSHTTMKMIIDFIQEAIILGRLCHSNIVSLVGLVVTDSETWIVTDYADSGNLEQFINLLKRSYDSKFNIISKEQNDSGTFTRS